MSPRRIVWEVNRTLDLGLQQKRMRPDPPPGFRVPAPEAFSLTDRRPMSSGNYSFNNRLIWGASRSESGRTNFPSWRLRLRSLPDEKNGSFSPKTRLVPGLLLPLPAPIAAPTVLRQKEAKHRLVCGSRLLLGLSPARRSVSPYLVANGYPGLPDVGEHFRRGFGNTVELLRPNIGDVGDHGPIHSDQERIRHGWV